MRKYIFYQDHQALCTIREVIEIEAMNKKEAVAKIDQMLPELNTPVNGKKWNIVPSSIECNGYAELKDHKENIIRSQGVNQSNNGNNEIIRIRCYNKVETWTNRKKAMDFYLEAMMSCDGCEKERYSTVYEQLYAGLTNISDTY